MYSRKKLTLKNKTAVIGTKMPIYIRFIISNQNISHKWFPDRCHLWLFLFLKILNYNTLSTRALFNTYIIY